MGRALVALLCGVLIAAPAPAAYYEFTGTLSFADPSPGGSARFLPEGVSLSGSGVAYSSNGTPFRQIGSFAGVQGFTGSLTTSFGSTAGYTQMVFVSGIGPGMHCPLGVIPPPTGCFTTNTVGQPRLHGKMPVRGLAERFAAGKRNAAFRLTTAGKTGLGLGGTLPAISGSEPSVRFGTWTTGTVSEKNVVVESHPAKGGPVLGNITGMGSDNRTSMGMGTVQFVTPIRTVGLLGLPGQRAAIAKLTLNFAPEPGRAALLLAGCFALVILGASRKPTS